LTSPLFLSSSSSSSSLSLSSSVNRRHMSSRPVRLRAARRSLVTIPRAAMMRLNTAALTVIVTPCPRVSPPPPPPPQSIRASLRTPVSPRPRYPRVGTSSRLAPQSGCRRRPGWGRGWRHRGPPPFPGRPSGDPPPRGAGSAPPGRRWEPPSVGRATLGTRQRSKRDEGAPRGAPPRRRWRRWRRLLTWRAGERSHTRNRPWSRPAYALPFDPLPGPPPTPSPGWSRRRRPPLASASLAPSKRPPPATPATALPRSFTTTTATTTTPPPPPPTTPTTETTTTTTTTITTTTTMTTMKTPSPARPRCACCSYRRSRRSTPSGIPSGITP
uniref:Uncharacterized protein n=1 Tax=Petromyzon marinus TaxID=7757 RepID=S4RY55_PETMA